MLRLNLNTRACGSPLLPPQNNLYKTVMCRANITCSFPVECSTIVVEWGEMTFAVFVLLKMLQLIRSLKRNSKVFYHYATSVKTRGEIVLLQDHIETLFENFIWLFKIQAIKFILFKIQAIEFIFFIFAFNYISIFNIFTVHILVDLENLSRSKFAVCRSLTSTNNCRLNCVRESSFKQLKWCKAYYKFEMINSLQ